MNKTITIMDYANNTRDIDLLDFEKVERMEISIVSGDELLKISYVGGYENCFDSTEKRTIDFDDGHYTIYDKTNNVNLLTNPRWLTRNDSYDGLDIWMDLHGNK